MSTRRKPCCWKGRRAPRRSRCSTRPAPRISCATRSEEHTSELQSRQYLVCRLLLEKKKLNELVNQQAIGPGRCVGSDLLTLEFSRSIAHVPRVRVVGLMVVAVMDARSCMSECELPY